MHTPHAPATSRTGATATARPALLVLLTSVMVLSALATALAGPVARALPDAGGGDPPDSQQLGALDDYVRREIAATRAPGSSLVVVSRDEVLLESAYGDYPDAHAPQIIGSLSKSFTALAIMQLVEAGRVDLDAPVSTYLSGIPVGERITVRQLLNQTSGLGVNQRRHELDSLGEQGRFEYANVNYGLLGEIVTAASGTAYEDYLQTRILDLLGMTRTYTSLEAAKEGGLVPGHRNWFGAFIAQEWDYPGTADWGGVPAGYIISSPADMGRYLQMYLRGGEGIISEQSIDTMLTGAAETDPAGSYGMGWLDAEILSEPVKAHQGLAENYGASMIILPERGLATIMVANASDFLIASPMLASVDEGVVAHLTGRPEAAPVLGAWDYPLKYLLYDAALAAIALVALVPGLLLARRWRRRRRAPIRDPLPAPAPQDPGSRPAGRARAVRSVRSVLSRPARGRAESAWSSPSCSWTWPSPWPC